MKHRGDEAAFRDPVCGMEISRLTAAGESSYKGKTFYFCSAACCEAFEREPERYLSRHRQHGVKPK